MTTHVIVSVIDVDDEEKAVSQVWHILNGCYNGEEVFPVQSYRSFSASQKEAKKKATVSKSTKIKNTKYLIERRINPAYEPKGKELEPQSGGR